MKLKPEYPETPAKESNDTLTKIGALGLTVLDVSLTASAFHAIASTGGNSLKASFLAGAFGIGLGAFGFSMFLQGLKNSHNPNPMARKKSLTMVFSAMGVYALLSGGTNAITMGLDDGKQATAEHFVEEVLEFKDHHNGIIAIVNDEIVGFSAIKGHTEGLITSEISGGGVGQEGSGEGPISTQLRSHLSAINEAKESSIEFSQRHKPLRKQANALLSDMTYNVNRSDLKFEEKISLLKKDTNNFGGVAHQLATIWPVSTFSNLSEAFSKTPQEYQMEGISKLAARKIGNFYKPKGDKYSGIALTLKRSKNMPVPEWRSKGTFEYLFASPDIVYVLLLSFLLAGASPLMLAVIVLSRSNDHSINSSDGTPPDPQDFSNHHADRLVEKPFAVKTAESAQH